MWFVGVMLEREEQTSQRCLTMFQRKLREGHYKWAHKQVVSTSNWDTLQWNNHNWNEQFLLTKTVHQWSFLWTLSNIADMSVDEVAVNTGLSCKHREYTASWNTSVAQLRLSQSSYSINHRLIRHSTSSPLVTRYLCDKCSETGESPHFKISVRMNNESPCSRH